MQITENQIKSMARLLSTTAHLPYMTALDRVSETLSGHKWTILKAKLASSETLTPAPTSTPRPAPASGKLEPAVRGRLQLQAAVTSHAPSDASPTSPLFVAMPLVKTGESNEPSLQRLMVTLLLCRLRYQSYPEKCKTLISRATSLLLIAFFMIRHGFTPSSLKASGKQQKEGFLGLRDLQDHFLSASSILEGFAFLSCKLSEMTTQDKAALQDNAYIYSNIVSSNNFLTFAEETLTRDLLDRCLLVHIFMKENDLLTHEDVQQDIEEFDCEEGESESRDLHRKKLHEVRDMIEQTRFAQMMLVSIFDDVGRMILEPDVPLIQVAGQKRVPERDIVFARP